MIELLKVKNAILIQINYELRNDPITLITFRMEKYNLNEFKKMLYENILLINYLLYLLLQ